MLLTEITKRTKKSKLPVWYAKDFAADAESYLRYLKMKKYLRADIVIGTKAPMMAGDDWGGTWTWDRSGSTLIIYIEKKFIDAVLKKKAWASLKNLIVHEYKESENAVNLARQGGHINPFAVLAPRSGYQYDGEAHEVTTKEMWGMGESEYAKQLDLEYRYLYA